MLEFLYQDRDLWVINKPAELSMLADRTGEPNLWQLLKERGEKPYLVHRLDKGTSGVLLVARNQATQSRLTRMFAEREVGKFYVARVRGEFPSGRTQRIDLPLCKGRKSRYRVAGERANITHSGANFHVHQDRDGVTAITLARCLRHENACSHMLLKPITGRTHQLRVHLSWLGFPILGDHLYGAPADPAQQAARLMLHCQRLLVPGWGRFTAALPDGFEAGCAR